ncbi:uncharacterized protein TRIVIDRAFT_215821, partial [Trichoderma virens Gv29-8]
MKDTIPGSGREFWPLGYGGVLHMVWRSDMGGTCGEIDAMNLESRTGYKDIELQGKANQPRPGIWRELEFRSPTMDMHRNYEAKFR